MLTASSSGYCFHSIRIDPMKISETYTQTKALTAADVNQPTLKIIGSVAAEIIRSGPAKPVAWFTDGTKLILNQFNAFELATWYGDDTDQWTGKPVELYPASTMYQGSMVACIRVRQPQQTAAPGVPVASALAPKPEPGPAADRAAQTTPKHSASAPQPLSYQKHLDLMDSVEAPPF